jgi:hypothetical protein
LQRALLLAKSIKLCWSYNYNVALLFRSTFA